MVNNDSSFGDFVRFRPHTYARTQQSLPPLRVGIMFVYIRQSFNTLVVSCTLF